MNDRVYIERDGQRIIANIPWMNSMGPRMAKRVDGYRWSPSNKVWTYPLDLVTCRALRSVFREALDIGPGLADWARAEIAREAQLRRTAGHDLSTTMNLRTVEALAPDMASAMYARGYQTVAAIFGATARRFLLADAPGLGKSLESFGALLEGNITSGRVLIVAPKTSLRATWEPEIVKWLGEDLASVYVADGTRQQRLDVIDLFQYKSKMESTKLHFLIVNAEMVRWRKADKAGVRPEKVEFPTLHGIQYDAIIGDEVHRYLMRANPRSNNVSAVGYGFQQLRNAEDGMRMALTGTPMKGKAKNLWGTLHWLRPETYTSQWRWAKRYYVSEANEYASSGETITDILMEGAEEMMGRELQSIMLRRMKDELHNINPGWAPPPKTYIEVFVDLTPEQRRAYRRIEEDAEIQFHGQVMTVNGMLAEMTRLKQAAGCTLSIKDGVVQPALPSGKFDWLLDDFLPSRGITGDPATEQGSSKVVIASQFTKFINLWAAALTEKGIKTHVLTGETNDNMRARIIHDFQDNPASPRVFLLNTNAGGVSVTLDVADDMVIMDETWVPDEQEQVEDRIHRTSRTDHFVNITYVRSRDTIEEEIAAINQDKDATQKAILDGARGVEWARRKYGAKVTGS